jgi:hypothetical protein
MSPTRSFPLFLLAVLASVAGCSAKPTPPVSPASTPASAPAETPAGADQEKKSRTLEPPASGAPAPANTLTAPLVLLPVPPPPPTAGSSKVTIKTDPSWALCHQSYVAKRKDPAKDVAEMARACANATRFKPVGRPFAGSQSDQDPPQAFPLKAEAGHCYRVYAQSSEGVRDLDLAIKDSTGALAGEDSTDDPSPVVVEDGAVCFQENDAATVVVSVGLGKGTYAVEVWRD